jgi:tetratricopeptide (TPR) repeat protein
MPLETADQLHVRAAQGYVELGMCQEANAELEEIDPLCRHLPEVLVTHVMIYHALEKWELMAAIATKLVEWDPNQPGFFVDLAYATRRAESLEKAHAVLTRAEIRHPKDGLIQFNLACYEAQMGKLDRAQAHLERAIEIDKKFQLMALEDPDLKPLWESVKSSKL